MSRPHRRDRRVAPPNTRGAIQRGEWTAGPLVERPEAESVQITPVVVGATLPAPGYISLGYDGPVWFTPPQIRFRQAGTMHECSQAIWQLGILQLGFPTASPAAGELVVVGLDPSTMLPNGLTMAAMALAVPEA